MYSGRKCTSIGDQFITTIGVNLVQKPILVASVHDEVIFEINRSTASFHSTVRGLKSVLESVGKNVFGSIPSGKFPVAVNVGYNLGEMTQYQNKT